MCGDYYSDVVFYGVSNSGCYGSVTSGFNQSFFFFILESTQLEDPRQEWRAVQEAMLRDYLQTAQDVLEVSLTYDSHAYDCNRPQGDPSSYLCFFFFGATVRNAFLLPT